MPVWTNYSFSTLIWESVLFFLLFITYFRAFVCVNAGFVWRFCIKCRIPWNVVIQRFYLSLSFFSFSDFYFLHIHRIFHVFVSVFFDVDFEWEKRINRSKRHATDTNRFTAATRTTDERKKIQQLATPSHSNKMHRKRYVNRIRMVEWFFHWFKSINQSFHQ